MSCTFIPCQANQIPEVAAILAETTNSKWSKELLIKAHVDPRVQFWVALENRTVIGFAIINSHIREAEIHQIAIKVDYQRKGKGSHLLKEIINHCESKDCSEIFIEVRSDNQKALKFYQKNGFSHRATRKNYYSDKTDGLLLRRPLNVESTNRL